jgi:hypothetical protein
LSPDIPGTKTFAKPPEEGPREPGVGDSSIYRVDDADSLLKHQTKPDEIDHSHAQPTFRRPGPHYGPNKTKYPYRDGIPNRHNAAAGPKGLALIASVVQLYLLNSSPERVVSMGSDIRLASKIADILMGLNPKVQERSTKCAVSVKRADIPKLRWLFSVDAGNGPKVVKVKASRKGTTTALSKMDLVVSCSCKAWRWLGPEYHAKGESYMDGKPVGTASTPDIKDPERVNRVCKHVAAVLNQIQAWKIPIKK